MRLGTKRDLDIGENALSQNRRNTNSQMCDKLDRMFLNEKDTRQLMLDNIGLSYVLMDGDAEAVNRFYIEDKAIATYFPIFNVDIER